MPKKRSYKKKEEFPIGVTIFYLTALALGGGGLYILLSDKKSPASLPVNPVTPPAPPYIPPVNPVNPVNPVTPPAPVDNLPPFNFNNDVNSYPAIQTEPIYFYKTLSDAQNKTTNRVVFNTGMIKSIQVDEITSRKEPSAFMFVNYQNKGYWTSNKNVINRPVGYIPNFNFSNTIKSYPAIQTEPIYFYKSLTDAQNKTANKIIFNTGVVKTIQVDETTSQGVPFLFVNYQNKGYWTSNRNVLGR